jgi:hypothetical protein
MKIKFCLKEISKYVIKKYFYNILLMEQTNENVIKKERKQIEKRAPWRWNEDGTYNSKPISESYFKDYYRKNSSHHVECDFCKKIYSFC